MGIKTKIGAFIFIAGIILWQFGFFNRFNYLTAQIDILTDSPRIVVTEIPLYEPKIDPVSYTGLNEKYGFHQHYTGCNITHSELIGIDAYNSEIEKYLIKKNGINWKAKYQKEIKTLIKENNSIKD